MRLARTGGLFPSPEFGLTSLLTATAQQVTKIQLTPEEVSVYEHFPVFMNFSTGCVLLVLVSVSLSARRERSQRLTPLSGMSTTPLGSTRSPQILRVSSRVQFTLVRPHSRFLHSKSQSTFQLIRHVRLSFQSATPARTTQEAASPSLEPSFVPVRILLCIRLHLTRFSFMFLPRFVEHPGVRARFHSEGVNPRSSSRVNEFSLVPMIRS